jgi:hypothetical protein
VHGRAPRPAPEARRSAKGETRALGRADEAQAPRLRLAVAPHAARAVRRRHQPAPLVVAHGLHAHAARASQSGDRRLHPLTPYHGPHPTWGRSRCVQS